MRQDLRMSFPKISRELGRKDHTTAIHSFDKIEKAQAFDSNIREAIAEIRSKLNV
jgi:chromosomal replication initiator protein